MEKLMYVESSAQNSSATVTKIEAKKKTTNIHYGVFVTASSLRMYINTGLFKMIVGVQLFSGNSAPNSGNNHHLTISFEGGMHSFKRQGACLSRN